MVQNSRNSHRKKKTHNNKVNGATSAFLTGSNLLCMSILKYISIYVMLHLISIWYCHGFLRSIRTELEGGNPPLHPPSSYNFADTPPPPLSFSCSRSIIMQAGSIRPHNSTLKSIIDIRSNWDYPGAIMIPDRLWGQRSLSHPEVGPG